MHSLRWLYEKVARAPLLSATDCSIPGDTGDISQISDEILSRLSTSTSSDLVPQQHASSSKNTSPSKLLSFGGCEPTPSHHHGRWLDTRYDYDSGYHSQQSIFSPLISRKYEKRDETPSKPSKVKTVNRRRSEYKSFGNVRNDECAKQEDLGRERHDSVLSTLAIEEIIDVPDDQKNESSSVEEEKIS
jgi:hypothetical protein